jgi:hypothetical protein
VSAGMTTPEPGYPQAWARLPQQLAGLAPVSTSTSARCGKSPSVTWGNIHGRMRTEEYVSVKFG